VAKNLLYIFRADYLWLRLPSYSLCTISISVNDESLSRCLMLGLRTLLRRARLSAHPCAAVRHAVGLYKILTETNATLSQAFIISGTTPSRLLMSLYEMPLIPHLCTNLDIRGTPQLPLIPLDALVSSSLPWCFGLQNCWDERAEPFPSPFVELEDKIQLLMRSLLRNVS
jgi:hypothetical protein